MLCLQGSVARYHCPLVSTCGGGGVNKSNDNYSNIYEPLTEAPKVSIILPIEELMTADEAGHVETLLPWAHNKATNAQVNNCFEQGGNGLFSASYCQIEETFVLRTPIET